MEKIKVLLADDHNILRQGLADALRNYEDIMIWGEAENGNQLIEKYREILPDVVLTDIEMPKLSGFDAAVEILKKYPNAKILFLSMYFSEDYVYKAEIIGGKGMLSKEIYKEELVNAIREVNAGKTYYYGLNEKDLERIRMKNNQIENRVNSNTRTLTVHEHEILMEISKGVTISEIVRNTGVGEKTVIKLISAIMNKLNIENEYKLIKYAISYGKKYKKKQTLELESL